MEAAKAEAAMPPQTIEVLDWKTSSDPFRYGKTGGQLKTIFALLIFAVAFYMLYKSGQALWG